jgi:hypothetical protein
MEDIALLMNIAIYRIAKTEFPCRLQCEQWLEIRGTPTK